MAAMIKKIPKLFRATKKIILKKKFPSNFPLMIDRRTTLKPQKHQLS